MYTAHWQVMYELFVLAQDVARLWVEFHGYLPTGRVPPARLYQLLNT